MSENTHGEPTYEMAVNAFRTHIDSHINQWRENHNHADPALRQRAIDATDALQQLRKSLLGELLPLDNGNFKIFTHCGEQSATFGTHEEAVKAYETAPMCDAHSIERIKANNEADRLINET